MSVFSEDIYLDERDLLKQKVYEEWIKKLNAVAFEIQQKSSRGSSNYIMAGAAMIEQLDKVYVIETKFI